MKSWKISDYTSLISANRMLLQQVFFSLALISLAFNFWYHISLSQIGSNPILYQDVDPTYLLFMYLGIPQFLSGWPAPYFDALLVASCIAAVIFPRYRIFPLVFFLLYFVYFVAYNMFSGHHYISIGLLVMSFPFIFLNASRFASMFTICRFIFCFMMFSAACWKIVRGNLWHVDQTNMLLVNTYADELLSGRDSLISDAVRWLIRHKAVSHSLWCLLILVEGVFVAGFLTFRWDRILLASYLVFFVGGWLIFKVYNYDNLLFLLTLTPILNYVVTFRIQKST
jgi:hypothetical protein